MKAKVLSLVVMLFVGAQFIRPDTTVPTVDPSASLAARAQAPPDVRAVLERSCRDCHSYNTRWPWYSRVAPISWWLAGHVNDGRRHFNASTWGTLEPAKASHALEEVCEVVQQGEMPLPSYLIAHREAAVSAEAAARICEWTQVERRRLAALLPGAR